MEELLKDESEDPLASSDDEGTSQRTLRDDPEEGDGDEPATNITIPNLISERVAVMARNLTEYFQCQRMAYEMVRTFLNCSNMFIHI